MDGSPVWVNLTRSIQYDDAGQSGYFIALVEDISERKRAEEELRESEDRYRKLFKASLAGVYITKETGLHDARGKTDASTLVSRITRVALV